MFEEKRMDEGEDEFVVHTSYLLEKLEGNRQLGTIFDVLGQFR